MQSQYQPQQSHQSKKPSISFTPEAPKVQARAEAPQRELPKLSLDENSFQGVWESPFARCFIPEASPPPIQPKLTVGAVGDKYEQEADDVASQVVKQINIPGAEIQRESELEEEVQLKPLQRVGEEGGAIDSGLESQINSAKGGGQSLDSDLKQSMGQAMGADFSGVKVHTDSQSDQLNQSIQAKAFTTGSDVFFKQGEYNPSSKSGQELIAHELTHVVQQTGSSKDSQAQVLMRCPGNRPDDSRPRWRGINSYLNRGEFWLGAITGLQTTFMLNNDLRLFLARRNLITTPPKSRLHLALDVVSKKYERGTTGRGAQVGISGIFRMMGEIGFRENIYDLFTGPIGKQLMDSSVYSRFNGELAKQEWTLWGKNYWQARTIGERIGALIAVVFMPKSREYIQTKFSRITPPQLRNAQYIIASGIMYYCYKKLKDVSERGGESVLLLKDASEYYEDGTED